MDFTQTGGRIAAFFDLDGTLALGNRPPSPQDAEAIRAMRAAGHLAFLCTGRARGFLYPAVTDIGFDGIVAGAGAHITVGDKTLLRRSLGPETLRLIIAHFLHTGQTCVLEGERGMYLINDRANLPAEWPRVKDPADFEGPLAGRPVTKITVYGVCSPETRQLLAPHLTIIAHADYMEATPLGCTKSAGMRLVLEAVGIPREDSVAFGDSNNDLDMLRYAGIGVAMGNADARLKSIADVVTDTNTNAGVAKAMYELALHRPWKG